MSRLSLLIVLVISLSVTTIVRAERPFAKRYPQLVSRITCLNRSGQIDRTIHLRVDYKDYQETRGVEDLKFAWRVAEQFCGMNGYQKCDYTVLGRVKNENAITIEAYGLRSQYEVPEILVVHLDGFRDDLSYICRVEYEKGKRSVLTESQLLYMEDIVKLATGGASIEFKSMQDAKPTEKHELVGKLAQGK